MSFQRRGSLPIVPDCFYSIAEKTLDPLENTMTFILTLGRTIRLARPGRVLSQSINRSRFQKATTSKGLTKVTMMERKSWNRLLRLRSVRNTGPISTGCTIYRAQCIPSQTSPALVWRSPGALGRLAARSSSITTRSTPSWSKICGHFLKNAIIFRDSK